MPGFIGFPELLLLGLVVLVLFGPKRLPEMGRGLGKGLREFKDSVSGDHADHAERTVDVPTDLVAATSMPVPATTPGEPVVIRRRDVA